MKKFLLIDIAICVLSYHFGLGIDMIWKLFFTLFFSSVFVIMLYHPTGTDFQIMHMNMDDVNVMTGEEFELVLCKYFELQGYSVEHVGKTRDFGADLILKKRKEKTAVQVKRYTTKVGVHAIQEVVSAKEYYSCNKAIVITNSNFTKPAEQLAEKCDVQLLNGNDVKKMIEK